MIELLWWFGQNTLAALLMIPCVMLACRMFPDRPAVQHLLWLVILLKFVTPPVVVWPWSVDELQGMAWSQHDSVQVTRLEPSPAVPSRAEPTVSEASPEIGGYSTHVGESLRDSQTSASRTDSQTSASRRDAATWLRQADASVPAKHNVIATTVLLLWSIGALVCLVSQLRRLTRYARLLRNGSVAPLHLNQEIASVATLLRIKAPVSLVVKGIASPFLWCVGTTRLAWPDSMASSSHVVRSRGIIAHELAHLHRRDHWITWLELGASILWWWNPMFWFVRRQLRETAEISCDALAIAATPESRHDYAELLLQLSSQNPNGVPAPVLAVGAGNARSFERRLKMILSPNVSGKLSWSGALTIAVLSVIALPYWSLAQPANPEPNAALTAQNNAGNDTPTNLFGVSGQTEDMQRKGQEEPNSIGTVTLAVLPRVQEKPQGNEVGQRTSSPKDSPVAAVAQDSDIDEKTMTSVNSIGSGATLPPNIETLLEWGEPVDGLRGAVMIQTAVQKPELAERPKVLLVLQNVSDKSIRFCDTQMKKNDDVQVREDKRTLYLRDADIGILSGFSSGGGTDTDVELQPHEVATIDMHYSERPNENGRTLSAAMVDVILHNQSLSYSASLNLNTAPPGAWSGNLTAPASRGAFSAMGPLPKSAEAQKLFRYCLDNARLNGDIPGGMIDRLKEKVLYFIELNTGDQSGDPYAKKMQAIVARFEKAGDWSQADAVKLFDDIAEVTTIPLMTTLDAIREHTLQRGQVLPASLQSANWGKALPGGLRMAWILEPVADQYRLGSSLKSRVVIHNSGKEPVAFVTRSFHQPAHSAINAAGAAIQLESTMWTTIGRPEPYRLHPGEYCEVYAPGIGVGPRDSNDDDWANIRPGTWILASEGDDVVFQSGDVWLSGDHNQRVDPDWWVKFITERLNREAPLPSSEQARKLILFRVIENLFGGSPTPDEAESFYGDNSPEAMDNLALLLSKRTWMTPVTGAIQSGPAKFKVLRVDPNAATRPRVVTNPGRYNVGDELRLVVTRRPSGSRIVNEANLTWYPKGQDSVPTPIAIPDGYNTWAAGWLPETSLLWVATKDSLRRYNCSNPASIQLQQFDGEQQSSATIPNELRAQLTATIASGETPQPTPGPVPATAADVNDD